MKKNMLGKPSKLDKPDTQLKFRTQRVNLVNTVNLKYNQNSKYKIYLVRVNLVNLVKVSN